jgi:aspartate/methionine/tyrosine aminotransferase
MKIKPFDLELYFAKYEFACKYMLCASDCESISIDELLKRSGTPVETLTQATLAYTESQGDALLREKIAQMTPGVDAEDVVFLSAPEEGIFTAMHALLQTGDHVIVVSPVYESLLNLAENITHNVSLWEFELNDNQWRLDEEALYQMATPETRLLIVNFPHNPTGYIPDYDMFSRILNWAAEHNITVFCDEMYRGLELNGLDPLPSAVQINPDAVVLTGLSKTYGLPGLRSGWLIVKNKDLRENILNWKMYTTICASRVSEVLTIAALQCREILALNNRELISKNLQHAELFFQRWSNLFEYNPPMAGSIGLMTFLGGEAKPFCEKLADDGFLLLPSAYMNFPDRYIRFGFGRKNFINNLDELDAYLSRNL